jgi:hypothetical protein
MFSRVNFLEVIPDRMDEVARVVRDVVHPAISAEPGYVGHVVLGDSRAGKAVGVTLWDTESEREASDARAREIRPRLERETGGTMISVEQFDVLFFDIPTPMAHDQSGSSRADEHASPVTKRLVSTGTVTSGPAVNKDPEAVRT